MQVYNKKAHDIYKIMTKESHEVIWVDNNPYPVFHMNVTLWRKTSNIMEIHNQET